MPTTEGTHRGGKIELNEPATGIPEGARVLVTFIDSTDVDLGSRGIDETQAARLRAALATFEDWSAPEMNAYDNYDV